MALGKVNLSKVLIAGVDACLAVDDLIHKEGIFALIKYSSDFSALGGVDPVALKNEIFSLSDVDKKEIEDLIKGRLVLHDAALQVKINAGIDVVDLAISIVEKLISDVTALVEKAKAIGKSV